LAFEGFEGQRCTSERQPRLSTPVGDGVVAMMRRRCSR